MFTGVIAMADRVDSRLPYFALVIGMLAISTSAILIRLSNSDPLVIGSYRQSFATLLFVPFLFKDCLLYTSPSPRDATLSRMPSSA